MEAKPSALQTIGERFENVRARIRAAAGRAGRPPHEIQLIAISKTHSVEAIREALAAGVSDLGENRVQEAAAKINEIGCRPVLWHLVGHLQTNKARRAVRLFYMIHSVDSPALVERLEQHCEEINRPELPILAQIDLAGEETKSGVDSASLPAVLKAAKR